MEDKTILFINKAKKVWGDKFDYSNVEYINATTMVQIICRQHGLFLQLPRTHLKGGACPQCSIVNRSLKQTKWNKENILLEAHKYSSISELAKHNKPLYYAIHRHKVDVSFLSKKIKQHSFEEIFQIAKRFKYKKDFKEQCPLEYSASIRHKWMKEFNWFEIPEKYKGNKIDNPYVVYVYEDYPQKIAYIGLTNNIKRRHYEHSSIWKNHKPSAVYRYFYSIGQIVPNPKILQSKLTSEESQSYENFWVEKYISEGWNLLNKGKTGIGVGSLGSYLRKWTFDKCKIEAQKYNSISDFAKGSKGAYWASLQNDWINDFFDRKIISSPRSKERFIEEAKRYKSTGEFIRKSVSMYRYGLANGWLEECTWLKRGHSISKWNLDACINEALKYSSFIEYRDKSPNSCRAAYRNGYIDVIRELFNKDE